MTDVVLPRVMSKLIRIGLADLRKAEQDPRYSVIMATWHAPCEGGPCLVCLAGAVMAFSLGASPNERLTPRSPEITSHNAAALRALNWLREGCVETAAEYLGIPPTDKMKAIECAHYIPPYAFGSDGFHAAMESLAADLEANGL